MVRVVPRSMPNFMPARLPGALPVLVRAPVAEIGEELLELVPDLLGRRQLGVLDVAQVALLDEGVVPPLQRAEANYDYSSPFDQIAPYVTQFKRIAYLSVPAVGSR